MNNSYRHPVREGVTEVYKDTDLMLGIQYIMEKARVLAMPVVICIGVGTNQGAHDGSLILEEYINAVSNIKGTCVCAAARK
jgi:hypothetical protein